MAGWEPFFVLPNIGLEEPIEGDAAILAPPRDCRVADLSRTHPNFRAFLGRFSDAFGDKLAPTVLLVRSDAPESFRKAVAVANFRDLIALSVVPYNRALELKHPRGHRVLFANAFAFYPWMIDKNYEHLIGNSPAILGLHEVGKFRGQSSPELFRMNINAFAIDRPLLVELLARWRRRYTAVDPEWSDIALFRSLNMAYQGSLLPGLRDTTFYDVGRFIALWVSAFEILVHPGEEGQANRDSVFALLESVAWQSKKCARKCFETGGRKKIKRTLASWLYQALNERRNDFLHGNPVTQAHLLLPGTDRSLFQYAAPLYRMALTGFLPLIFDQPAPSSSDSSALAAHIAEQMDFLDPQLTFEEALMTAREPNRHPRSTTASRRHPTSRAD